MNQNDAMAIAETWRSLHDDPAAVQDLSAHLWRALMSLMPEPCVAGAVVLDGTPTIIGVAGSSLLEATVDERSVRVRHRIADSTRGNVALTETLVWTRPHPAVVALKRIRTWTFDLGDGGSAWSWETDQIVQGGFRGDQGISPNEQLARHVAAALGWRIASLENAARDWAD